MKYCYKCGNELFDEAIICPKCGVPQSNLSENKKSKTATASMLNLISFILNGLFSVFFVWLLQPTDDRSNTSTADVTITITPESTSGISPEPNPEFFIVWLALAIGIFVLGILISKNVFKTSTKMMSYIYVVIAILDAIMMNILFPNLNAMLFFVIGIVFYVPLILQIISGVKFLQGSKIK